MKKRLLSVCLSVAILLGAVAATGALSALAVTAGFTAGTVGQYKAWAQSTQLNTIMGDATNLIAGKTAYGSAYSGGATCGDGDTASSNWYHEADATHNCNYPGYAGGATDGVIGNHNNRATTEEIFRSNNTSSLRYFYYDLGAVYNVSDFIVASSQCNLDAANRVLKYIDVYVAEEWKETNSFTTHKGAFTTGNFTQVFGWSDAASETYIHQIQPANGETVAARYVCFVFKAPVAPNGSVAPIPINELAVYGTAASTPTPPPANDWAAGDNGAGRYKTFAQYDNTYLAGLGTSLVKDVVPYRKSSNDATPWTLGGDWSATVQSTSSASYLTDGIIRTSKTDAATSTFISTNRNMNYVWYFTFDLGAKYDLTDFVLASSQTDNADYLMRGVKVYVSDDLDTAISNASLVYSRWDAAADANARNFHIQPADGESVTGRYVTFGVKLYKDGLIRIEELAVYGTAASTPTPPPANDWTAGDNGAGRYKTFAQYDNAYLAGLTTGGLTNQVKNVIPYYGTSTGTLWSSKETATSGLASYLTDGAIRTAKTDTTTGSFNFNAGANGANRYYTFAMDAKYDFTDFVVASSQTDTASKYLLHSVKVYVGNDLSTLYTDNNLVYSRFGQEVDLTNRNFHIQPTNGGTATGMYVGFHLQTGTDDKVLRVEELAAYGTKTVIPPKQPDADGVIEWENGDAIDTENNLLKNAYAETNCNAYVSNAYTNKNANYNGWSTVMTNITDGNASTEGILYSWSHEDGYKEITVGDTTLTGTSGMASMAFNLGGTFSIEKLLVIGNADGSTAATWSYQNEADARKYWGEGGYKLKDADGRYHPIYADGTYRTFNDKIIQYYEVYISTSAVDLFEESNRVWTYTNKNQYQGTTYALPAAVEGSYIGYRFTTGSGGSAQGRVGELGVYGTAVDDIKIVTVGDSITHGANLAEGRYFKNYPAMLASLLNADTEAAKPYSVYNAGISGSTVVNYQLVDPAHDSDASWMTQATAAGHIRYADILTIMLGTNDANDWDSRKSLYKDEYKKIVNAYKALNPNVKLYIGTSPYTSTLSETALDEIVAMQKELATELGATLIDVHTATTTRVEDKGSNSLFKGGDLLHPHEKGQAYLSTLFYKAITGKDIDLGLDDEQENNTPWTEGALMADNGVPAGSLLQNATVDTDMSSNANGKWAVAFESLVNEDNSDAASIYAKDYEIGYPDAKNPVTGDPIVGTTGWAQMMFKLDGYYAIDQLLFYGQATANNASKWGYANEDSAKKYWGTNYVQDANDQKFYCADKDGNVRTFNDRNPQYIEVYVSEYPGMLFDKDSLVWTLDNTTTQYLGYGVTLPEAVKGRYVGVRVTTGSTFQARLGELAVYGQQTEKPYNGTLDWAEGDAIPDNNLLMDATYQSTDALGVSLGSNRDRNNAGNDVDGDTTTKASYYTFDEDTDQYYAEVINPATGKAIAGTSGWARIAFKLEKYTAVEKIMVLGSTGDKQSTQWGYATENGAKQYFGDNIKKHTDGKYYAAYADGTIRDFNNRQVMYYEVYIADNFETLFDAENLVYSYDNSRMLVDGAIHELDQPVEGRFVGFRTTAGSNKQTRVNELGVYGYTVQKDITLSANTAAGKVTYTISANNTPDRDALLQRVGSIKVTLEKLGKKVPKNIENNWLTVDGTTVYHVQLLDKNGKVFPDTSKDPTGGLNGRPVQISIPTTAKHIQALGTLNDGVIKRVFNSQKTLDGQVLAGTLEYPDYGTSVPNNREKAVISTSELKLVVLKFNDLDTINKLNGAVVNTPLGEFKPHTANGATAQADVLPAVAVAVLCVAAGVAAGWMIRRRRVRQ